MVSISRLSFFFLSPPIYYIHYSRSCSGSCSGSRSSCFCFDCEDDASESHFRTYAEFFFLFFFKPSLEIRANEHCSKFARFFSSFLVRRQNGDKMAVSHCLLPCGDGDSDGVSDLDVMQAYIETAEGQPLQSTPHISSSAT